MESQMIWVMILTPLLGMFCLLALAMFSETE
jgi:hypothetical protein